MANIVTFLLRQKLRDISQEELYSQEINVETAIFQLGYHYSGFGKHTCGFTFIHWG
ncbi:MAG TPA: hypothetical protein PLE52_00795 [Paludibacteraceae bacterium]|nr:hypothetical protein [Paludibacteraceae bacterium]